MIKTVEAVGQRVDWRAGWRRRTEAAGRGRGGCGGGGTDPRGARGGLDLGARQRFRDGARGGGLRDRSLPLLRIGGRVRGREGEALVVVRLCKPQSDSWESVARSLSESEWRI